MELNKKQMVRTSKFLSLVLRHQPDAAGITVDAHGWAEVGALLRGMTDAGVPCDLQALREIVRTDEKQRYTFNEDGTKIRASQGHSFPVDLGLTQTDPPQVLWHGTATRFLADIMQEGLKPMSRQYVHLSPDAETAYRVGIRHGKPVILQVDALRMVQDGMKIYRAENGVWLTDAVPPQYLQITGTAQPETE